MNGERGEITKGMRFQREKSLPFADGNPAVLTFLARWHFTRITTYVITDSYWNRFFRHCQCHIREQSHCVCGHSRGMFWTLHKDTKNSSSQLYHCYGTKPTVSVILHSCRTLGCSFFFFFFFLEGNIHKMNINNIKSNALGPLLLES